MQVSYRTYYDSNYLARPICFVKNVTENGEIAFFKVVNFELFKLFEKMKFFKVNKKHYLSNSLKDARGNVL